MPKIQADFALLLPLRDGTSKHPPLGWMRVCQEFLNLTGIPISKRTAKRRYYEAKKNTEVVIDAT
jgi:hypothetical protein